MDWITSENGRLLGAGAAGSAVSVALEWGGWNSATRRFVIGVLAAFYLSPLALPLLAKTLDTLNVPMENAPGVSGFVMGVVGVIVIETFLNAFRLWSRRPDNYRTVRVPIDPLDPVKEARADAIPDAKNGD